MAINLEELVHFVGEETPLVSRIKKAVEWVSSKPEGQAILEEARKLHGHPVHIVTDSSLVTHNIGFGSYEGKPAVFVNPPVVESAYLLTDNGESFPGSLERFFSHEFKHGTQPNLLEQAQEYAQRRQKYYEDSLSEIRVPFEQYQNRIQAAKNDEVKLKGILGEIYDTHILAPAKAGLQNMVERSANDEVMQEFTKKFENPAIDFENLMMKKYKGDPERSKDYMKSMHFDEAAWNVDRQGFIDNATASLKAAEQQKTARVGERGTKQPGE